MNKFIIKIILGFLIAFLFVIMIGIIILEWNNSSIDRIISLLSISVSVITIVFIMASTNKQIQNQNKEQHRPLIKGARIKEIPKNIGHEYLYSIHVSENSDMDNKTHKTNVNVYMNNIGYGIANNLRAYSCSDQFTISNGNIARRGHVTDYNEISVKEGVAFYLEIEITFFLNTFVQGINIPLLLFYSDLNGNVYSAFIDICKENDNYIVSYCFQSGTVQFSSKFKSYIEYLKIKNKYLKDVYRYDFE